jgi:hypothetical protein
MNTKRYSHNSAASVVPKEIVAQVQESLSALGGQLTRNCASDLRKGMLARLHRQGWSNQVPIRARYRLTLTSVNNSVGLCLQTGNMARFYADLLKLEVAYINELIKSAIYILPTPSAAQVMGSNIAHYDRLVQELPLYKHIVTIPILVLGFWQEE